MVPTSSLPPTMICGMMGESGKDTMTAMKQENGWLEQLINLTKRTPYSPLSIVSNQIKKVQNTVPDTYMEDIKTFIENETNNPTDRSKVKDNQISWYETFTGAISASNKWFDGTISGATKEIRKEADKLKKLFNAPF